MAYNPFDIFRRNQKAIFAVVTVVIMFVFVLSSGAVGRGDFFNWLPEWVHGRTHKGDILATLDRDKLRASDIEKVRFQRVLANKYLVQASALAMSSAEQIMHNLSEKGTPGLLQRFMQAQQSEQFGFAPPGTMQKQMQAILDDPRSNSTDKEVVSTWRFRETFQIRQFQYMQSGNYLNQTPNRSGHDRDVIEFMLWDRKAKQLGIEYGEDDVKKTLLPREFLDVLKTGDQKIRSDLSKDYRDRFTDDLLYKSIAAEFRVRAAQNAVVGSQGRSDHTLNAPPLFAAPYDLFEFYKEKLTATNYQALRVPVECFIPLVKEQPTEAELERLFNDRKQYEPDPSREEPGFREPRKVKVAWLSATGAEPYYTKKAAEWVKLTEEFAKSEIWAMTVPMPSIGIGMAVPIAVPTAMKEPLVREKYKSQVVDTFHNKVNFGWTGPSSFVMPYDILDTSVVLPQNLAAAVGAAAGAIGFGDAFLAPRSFLYATSIAAEQKARIKAGMPLFLGAVPGPSMLPTMLGGEAAFRNSLPQPLSLATYKPELLAGIEKSKAREFAEADLKELEKTIKDLKETGKSRDNAAKSLIADFIKTRGVASGASAQFQGEYTIGDDPGLAPLKAAYEKEENPHARAGQAGPVQFGKKFFWKEDFGRDMRRTKEPALGDFKPEFYEAPRSFSLTNEPMFLAWRTADEKERGTSFTEAKPRVIEAWKRIKARALAKAEADRLAAELRARPEQSGFSVIPAMLDMEAKLKATCPDAKAEKKARLFAITNVAPLVIGADTMSIGGGKTISSYQLTPTVNIPYPTPEMQKKLIDERKQPEKTAFVEADQPKDSYYVIVLENRIPRFNEEFQFDVYNTASGKVGTRFNQEYLVSAAVKARETILTLLKREFNYVETDEQKKKLDEREMKGNSEE